MSVQELLRRARTFLRSIQWPVVAISLAFGGLIGFLTGFLARALLVEAQVIRQLRVEINLVDTVIRNIVLGFVIYEGILWVISMMIAPRRTFIAFLIINTLLACAFFNS